MNNNPYGLSSTRQAAVNAADVAKAIMVRVAEVKAATRPMLSAVGIVPTTGKS